VRRHAGRGQLQTSYNGNSDKRAAPQAFAATNKTIVVVRRSRRAQSDAGERSRARSQQDAWPAGRSKPAAPPYWAATSTAHKTAT
jgi:hypothetical protein